MELSYSAAGSWETMVREDHFPVSLQTAPSFVLQRRSLKIPHESPNVHFRRGRAGQLTLSLNAVARLVPRPWVHLRLS